MISGQTWHWIDPVAGAAKAAEALRAGARLAAFRNDGQPAADVAEAFAAVYRRVMPDLPFNPWARPAPEASSALVTKAADGIREAGAFSDPEQWRFEWECSYTRDDWLDQVPTTGGLTQLPPAQLEQLLAGIGAAVDAVGAASRCGTSRQWSPQREPTPSDGGVLQDHRAAGRSLGSLRLRGAAVSPTGRRPES